MQPQLKHLGLTQLEKVLPTLFETARLEQWTYELFLTRAIAADAAARARVTWTDAGRSAGSGEPARPAEFRATRAGASPLPPCGRAAAGIDTTQPAGARAGDAPACDTASFRASTERTGRPAGCHAGAERMFERTLEYAKEREAFGRPIGRFQAIRHKFADMATKIEAAKQFTYTVAWRFANGEYPVREITMAKLYSSRVACEVADECVQILGGYGYMKEYEIERAYRDVRLNRIGAGTDEIMLDVIGRSYGL